MSYLTVKEAAAHLKTSPDTVYRLIKKRAIPCARVGRKILFSQAMLDEWMLRKMTQQ